MTQTLYSLRTDGDQYRITKIVDGEIESSYLSTERECECPAGHRPSCRHRQMIPEMLARGICDSMWFWDFDLHRVVDFNGELKSNLDALNELAYGQRDKGDALRELAAISGITVVDIGDPAALHNTIAEAVGEAQHTEVPTQPSRSWRRL